MTRLSLALALLAATPGLVGCPDNGVSKIGSPPNAEITYPAADAEITAGSITARAVVEDPDGAAEALQVTWLLNGAEVCGVTAPSADGLSSCDLTLEAGSTTISVEAVDHDGKVGSDAISVEVFPYGEPWAEISSPEAGGVYYSDQSVELAGSVGDELDDPELLIVTWTSSEDGTLDCPDQPDDAGNVSCSALLSEDQHSISLTVENSGGNTDADSVTINVSSPNESPTCNLTGPETGAVGDDGDLVSFEGLVSDNETTASQLEVSWISDKDGEFGQTTADSDGTVVYSYSGLSVDTHRVTLKVVDDGEAECTSSITYTVGSAPDLSLDAPGASEVFNEGDEITFSAQVADAQDSATSLDLSWESDLDGVFSTQGADSSGLASFSTDSLSTGRHSLNVTVTDRHEMATSVSRSFTVNAVPTAPTVTLSPDPAGSSDDLLASASGSTDPDGSGTVSYRYAWFENGTYTLASTSAIFPASYTTRGMSYRVVVTPTDGTGDGPSGQAELTVGNADPVVATPTLSPSSGLSCTSTVSCSASATDADGDSTTLGYAWTNTTTSASLGSGSSLTLSSGSAAAGDTIQCTATADDGHGGSGSASATVLVEDCGPSVASVTISPDPATVGDTLECGYSGFSDPSGGSDASTFAWTIGGVAAGTSSTLSSGFVRGDTVTCTVTPSNGSETGTPVSDSLTVSNAAPELSDVAISPSSGVTTDTTLTCSATASDADGDSTTASYGWTNVTTSASLGSGASLTLSDSTASDGDTISCSATVSDGWGGADSGSASVLVSAGAPSIASVDVSPDPAFAADTLVCSYSGFDDPEGDADLSTYAWTIGGVAAGTASTLSGGFVRGDVVTCIVTPSDGVHDGAPVSDSLTISNTAPELDDVTLTPSPAWEGSAFSCTPGTAADDDGDTVGFSYAWDVEGVDPGVTSATLSSAYFDRDETVTCTVTPSDGFDSGTPVLSNSVTVSNSAPSVASVSISPSSPDGDDTLTCSYTGYSDPDGDSDASTFAWTVDGGAAGTGSALGSGFGGGDLVTCTVTPSDGSATGTPVSASVTITNTPPVISGLELSPSEVFTDTDISAVYATSDADGDSVSVGFAWTVDGVDPGETSGSLSGDDFERDQVVELTVTPYDGVAYGSPAVVSVTVSNSAPTAPDVTVLPHAPSVEGGDLLCTIESASTDADGDSFDYEFSWTVDGEDYLPGGGADTGLGWLGAEDTVYTGDTVPEEDLESGQEWVCEVSGDDGTDVGEVGSDTTVVGGSGMGVWPGASMSLSEADWGFLGEAVGDDAGYAIASAGDVDGDGLDDVLIGAFANDDGGTDAGKVYLFFGSSLSGRETLDLALADYTFVGEGAENRAGESVAFAGDVDGDGLDDILIGAPYWNSSNDGRAYLIYASSLGSSTTIDLSTADHIFQGSSSYDSLYFGRSVSSAGDFNGDGLDDVVIGNGWSRGSVSIFLSSSMARYTYPQSPWDADYWYRGENSNDQIGSSVACAGDVDGDGLEDILIGANGRSSYQGAVYLILGNTSSGGDYVFSSSTYHDQLITGAQAGDYAGYSVSSAGDVDGDGLDDILIGAMHNDDGGAYAGQAYVVLASTLTLGGHTIQLSWQADYTFTGRHDHDYLGESVATAGDVDGDGLSDLLLGAYGNDDGGGTSGKTYLILGSSLPTAGGEIDEWMSLFGAETSDQSGRGLAAGDVDGDGLDEILIGSHENDEAGSSAGKAYIMEPSTILASSRYVPLTDVTLYPHAIHAGSRVGWAVSTAGDIDADGLDDFLIGAPEASGGNGDTYLLLGSSIGTGDLDLTLSDHIFQGISVGDASGYALAGLGDVQGDGLDDFVIGANGRDASGTDSGAVYLIYGDFYTTSTTSLSTADLILKGEYANDNAGSALAAAGDVDGDGFMDLLVGAPYNDDAYGNSGKAYLVTGQDMITSGSSATLSIAHHGFLGESVNDMAGSAVASAGDVDGDGQPDLLIGAPGDDDGGSNAGKAYLVLASTVAGLGSNPSLADADYYFTGEAAADAAGSSLAGVGDVDGDGLDDFMVGASGNDSAGTDAGAAYLLLGSSLSASGSLASADSVFTGAAAGDALGHVVASAGDVDFDGFGDALITAPYHDMGGTDAGASYLLFGQTLRAGTASYDMADPVYDYAFIGDTDDNYAGWAAGTAGDVNGDGYSDLIFGAYGYSSQTGRAYLALSPGE